MKRTRSTSPSDDGAPCSKRQKSPETEPVTGTVVVVSDDPSDTDSPLPDGVRDFAASIKQKQRRARYVATWRKLSSAVWNGLEEATADVARLTASRDVLDRLGHLYDVRSPGVPPMPDVEAAALDELRSNIADQLVDAERRTRKPPRLFIPLTERNEHEGETWRFWLQVDGNEDALARLRLLMSSSSGNKVKDNDGDDDDDDDEDDDDSFTWAFSLEVELYDEESVDEIVSASCGRGGYMDAENKVVGVMDLLSADTEMDVDLLYKGAVTSLFTRRQRKK